MISTKSWSNTSHEIEEIHHEWTIEKFGLLFDLEAIGYLDPPKFPKERSDVQFCLRLLTYQDNLRVRLHSYSNSNYKCAITIWVKGFNKFRKFSRFQLRNDVTLELMTIDFFKKERKNLLINDKLVIYCVIYLAKNMVHEISNIFDLPNCKLAEDFGALLDTKEFADVTIIIDDDKIPVHKTILSARSKVFAAMLKHSMKENAENCITISDISSHVVMEMLRFMYTGKSPNLKDMAVDLMAAADKYELDGLKAMCAKSMCDNLSIATAPIVLKAADLYNLEDLKSAVIIFIKCNFPAVTETSNWKDIITTDSNLIFKTFIKPNCLEFKLNNDTSIGEADEKSDLSDDNSSNVEKSVKSD